jgi:hypothetical protein
MTMSDLGSNLIWGGVVVTLWGVLFRVVFMIKPREEAARRPRIMISGPFGLVDRQTQRQRAKNQRIIEQFPVAIPRWSLGALILGAVLILTGAVLVLR